MGVTIIFLKRIDCKFDLKQCTWLKQCTKDWIETIHKMLSIAMSKHTKKMAPICPAGRIIIWKRHSWGKMLQWLRIPPCKPANCHQKQALFNTGSYFIELYLIFWSRVEMVEIPSQWRPNVQPNQFESEISRQNNGGKFFTLFDAKYTSLIKF